VSIRFGQQDIAVPLANMTEEEMAPGDWISLVAILFSVLSLVISARRSRAEEKTGLRPVLVFVHEEPTGWRLQNIGKGPALNILIAKRDDREDWFDIARVPPLPENGAVDLSRWGKTVSDEAGATYQDFKDNAYSSICKDDRAHTSDGSICFGEDKDIKALHEYAAGPLADHSHTDQSG
jgi:hypothetical protein